jgi:hypothetical protein
VGVDPILITRRGFRRGRVSRSGHVKRVLERDGAEPAPSGCLGSKEVAPWRSS